MAINDDDMLSAMSEGLDAGSSPAPVVDDSAEDSDNPGSSVENSDTQTENEGSQVENSDTPADETPVAEAEVLDKDGKKAEITPKLDKDGKPVVEPKPVAEQKPVVKDPVNDPIPALMKKETRERIQTLVTTVKSVASERDAAVAERNELVGFIQQTGSTPAQYGDALNTLKMLNSGDPVQVERAIGFLQQVISANARAIGKPVAGVDMLEGHVDLQEEVANGMISQKRAEEIAGSRERQRIETVTSQQRQQAQQAEAATTQAVNQGKSELNALGERLRSSDNQFEAKHAIIVGALRDAIAVAHPSRWASMYENAYKGLKLPTAVSAARTPIGGSNVQPLRAKTPAGGQQKAPGSLLDAINMGLENARR